MARNDYFVVAYRILAYLYACLKEGDAPDSSVISAEELGIPPTYWEYVIRHLYADGYIEGVSLLSVTGRLEPAIKFGNLNITPKGIEFFQENSAMAKARDFLKTLKETIPGI